VNLNQINSQTHLSTTRTSGAVRVSIERISYRGPCFRTVFVVVGCVACWNLESIGLWLLLNRWDWLRGWGSCVVRWGFLGGGGGDLDDEG